ncbi:uncharacterized protein [Procambarus clarkii]|uniref:uncharacterized protein n=1 Tax=Procambarus clarkii TaxID=6728 RepID=UPI0037431EC0
MWNDLPNHVKGCTSLNQFKRKINRTQAEHDKALRATLQRLREKNLTLSRAKCEFNQHKIEFFGHVLSDKDLSPDPKKVADIKNAAPPSTSTEVHSFLGMANYSSRFIPDFASITKPLRELLE